MDELRTALALYARRSLQKHIEEALLRLDPDGVLGRPCAEEFARNLRATTDLASRIWVLTQASRAAIQAACVKVLGTCNLQNAGSCRRATNSWGSDVDLDVVRRKANPKYGSCITEEEKSELCAELRKLPFLEHVVVSGIAIKCIASSGHGSRVPIDIVLKPQESLTEDFPNMLGTLDRQQNLHDLGHSFRGHPGVHAVRALKCFFRGFRSSPPGILLEAAASHFFDESSRHELGEPPSEGRLQILWSALVALRVLEEFGKDYSDVFGPHLQADLVGLEANGTLRAHDTKESLSLTKDEIKMGTWLQTYQQMSKDVLRHDLDQLCHLPGNDDILQYRSGAKTARWIRTRSSSARRDAMLATRERRLQKEGPLELGTEKYRRGKRVVRNTGHLFNGRDCVRKLQFLMQKRLQTGNLVNLLHFSISESGASTYTASVSMADFANPEEEAKVFAGEAASTRKAAKEKAAATALEYWKTFFQYDAKLEEHAEEAGLL